MDRQVPVIIDHIGIMGKGVELSAGIYYRLGFVADGARTKVQLTTEQKPPNIHRFIFDNAYFECSKAAPEDSFYKYVTDTIDAHELMLASEDIVATMEKLTEQGFSLSDVIPVARPADHGIEKGMAEFDLVLLQTEIVPRSMFAVLRHKTPALIYQPGRYIHPNGVTNMGEMVLCCEDAAQGELMAEKIPQICGMLNGDIGDRSIRSMRIMDESAVETRYGVKVDAARNNFVGVTFIVPSLDRITNILRNESFSFRDYEDGILVDLSEELGMFVVFQRD